LDVTPDGTRVTNFTAFTDCNPVPLKSPLSMKIDRSGAFHLSTVRKDILGNGIRVVVSGKFVSRGRAKGSYKFSAPGCVGRSVAFSATFQRPEKLRVADLVPPLVLVGHGLPPPDVQQPTDFAAPLP